MYHYNQDTARSTPNAVNKAAIASKKADSKNSYINSTPDALLKGLIHSYVYPGKHLPHHG